MPVPKVVCPLLEPVELSVDVGTATSLLTDSLSLLMPLLIEFCLLTLSLFLPESLLFSQLHLLLLSVLYQSLHHLHCSAIMPPSSLVNLEPRDGCSSSHHEVLGSRNPHP